MALDVPFEALMEDPTRMGDDNSDEGSDPIKSDAKPTRIWHLTYFPKL